MVAAVVAVVGGKPVSERSSSQAIPRDLSQPLAATAAAVAASTGHNLIDRW